MAANKRQHIFFKQLAYFIGFNVVSFIVITGINLDEYLIVQLAIDLVWIILMAVLIEHYFDKLGDKISAYIGLALLFVFTLVFGSAIIFAIMLGTIWT